MHISWAALLLLSAVSVFAEEPPKVGQAVDGGIIASTNQLIRPAGKSVEFNGRPVDAVMATDGKTLFVKDNRDLVVIDVDTWRVKQELALTGTGGSMHGVVLSPDGSKVYLTSAHNLLFEGAIDSEGKVSWARKFDLPKPRQQAASQSAGM